MNNVVKALETMSRKRGWGREEVGGTIPLVTSFMACHGAEGQETSHGTKGQRHTQYWKTLGACVRWGDILFQYEPELYNVRGVL